MTSHAFPMSVLAPLGWIGRSFLGTVHYLGQFGVLTSDTLGAIVRPGRWDDAPGWTEEARWILGMGLPISALVHVGMGSFLSMQAFFGGTFVDGAGAVVGVGLIRNVAPLLVGFILAGLFAARLTPRFHELARPAPKGPREGFLSRTEPGRVAEPAPEPPAIPPRA
ncbi:MAG: organic solvent ABC transporter permease, partial [Isosphaeraceae bacterium]